VQSADSGTDGHLHHLCKRLPSPLDLAIRRFAPASWFEAQRAHYEMRDQSYDRPMEAPFLSGCFMFFRSAVLSRLDGFDERYFLYIEDLDLSRRAAVLARNLYTPDIQIVHGPARRLQITAPAALLQRLGAEVFQQVGWFEQPWFAARRSGH